MKRWALGFAVVVLVGVRQVEGVIICDSGLKAPWCLRRFCQRLLSFWPSRHLPLCRVNPRCLPGIRPSRPGYLVHWSLSSVSFDSFDRG